MSGRKKYSKMCLHLPRWETWACQCGRGVTTYIYSITIMHHNLAPVKRPSPSIKGNWLTSGESVGWSGESQAYRVSQWAHQVGWWVCHWFTPINHQGVTLWAFCHQPIPSHHHNLPLAIPPFGWPSQGSYYSSFIYMFYLPYRIIILLVCFYSIKRNIKWILFPAPIGCKSQPVPPNTASNGQGLGEIQSVSILGTTRSEHCQLIMWGFISAFLFRNTWLPQIDGKW